MSGLDSNRRERMHRLVQTIDRDLGATPEGMRAAWDELVELLDLGTAPAVRSCPGCGKVGMAAATRCGYCWAPLEALPSTPAGATS